MSLIGADLLQDLPPDAVVRRHHERLAVNSGLAGADGHDLLTSGWVTLVFTISGIPFRHTFRVLHSTGPRPNRLFLLGGCFFAPREGDIKLRVDRGDGNLGHCEVNHSKYGRVRLPLASPPIAAFKSPCGPNPRQPTRDAEPIAAAFAAEPTASANVTTNLAPPSKEFSTALSSNDTPKENTAPSSHPLADWIQEPRTHLLFNPTPFSVPPRTERTLLLRAP